VVCLKEHLESECPDLYPKQLLLNSMRRGELRSENRRVVRVRKGVKSRKVVAGGVERGERSWVLSLGEIDLGSLLLEMGKMDKSYEAEFEQVAVYSHYCQASNICKHH
jgi:hypothetical protein